MTAQETRSRIVALYKSRQRKNRYTQGANRGYFFGKPEGMNPGYSDCSSSVRAVYKRVLGVDIGSNTDAQVRSKRGTVVDTTTGLYPNEANLRPGDTLYFKGNNSHTEGVGHVELYIGNGQCAGHGSGTGPKVHNLRNYCRRRRRSKRYYKAIRWIPDDDAIPTTGQQGTVVITGGSVWIRSGPGKKTAKLGVVHKGDVLNRTGADTDGWRAVNYEGQAAFVSARYSAIKQ
ncbi:MAG: NlpC/P60 family protein [Synergistaceae bacterium]|nr:NlpC/P60 family protein [Synergistaceae bacterium]MDD3916242.1 NlpC/P60 family protein [Synergistaceae bacterium]